MRCCRNSHGSGWEDDTSSAPEGRVERSDVERHSTGAEAYPASTDGYQGQRAKSAATEAEAEAAHVAGCGRPAGRDNTSPADSKEEGAELSSAARRRPWA